MKKDVAYLTLVLSCVCITLVFHTARIRKLEAQIKDTQAALSETQKELASTQATQSATLEVIGGMQSNMHSIVNILTK